MLKEQCNSFIGILSITNNYLGYYLKYLREIIFEDIRIKHFNDRPSRLHGIWLCSEEEVEKWTDIIGHQTSVEIYKVVASGNIHHANASLILADTLQIFEYEELAKSYWTEVPFEKEYCKESELIFEKN